MCELEQITLTKKSWNMRIGLHTGPLVAGIIGKRNSVLTFGETP